MQRGPTEATHDIRYGQKPTVGSDNRFRKEVDIGVLRLDGRSWSPLETRGPGKSSPPGLLLLPPLTVERA